LPLGRPRANHHPTVKSVDLMRWLCRLVTPPGGLVLDMFAGSGSTGVAAIAEGFHFLGIEQEPEYYAIAHSRLEHVLTTPVQRALFAEAVQA
jgi:site-specific DNA-methyltransferase (adenine-specific)